MPDNTGHQNEEQQRTGRGAHDQSERERLYDGFSVQEERPLDPSALSDSRLNGRGNGGVRAHAMQQAQQIHGNRAVQRAVQRAVHGRGAGGSASGVQVQRFGGSSSGTLGEAGVLQELQARNTPNEGRWSADMAASMDTFVESRSAFSGGYASPIDPQKQFRDETGLSSLMEESTQLPQFYGGRDSTLEQYATAQQAGADFQKKEFDLQSTRNRYQQTTDYQGPIPGQTREQVHGEIDTNTAAEIDYARGNPVSRGIGASQEEMIEHSLAGRSPEERAALEAFQNPGPQELAAQNQQIEEHIERASAQASAHDARVEASEAGSFRRMGRSGDGPRWSPPEPSWSQGKRGSEEKPFDYNEMMYRHFTEMIEGKK